MSGNRSLDEFADAGADEGAAEERSTDGEVPGGRTDANAEPAADDGGSVERVIDDEGRVDDEPGGTAAGEDSGAETLERPASTYVWQPDGKVCAGCGVTVDERWRDGDDLVCGDCKEW